MLSELPLSWVGRPPDLCPECHLSCIRLRQQLGRKPGYTGSKEYIDDPPSKRQRVCWKHKSWLYIMNFPCNVNGRNELKLWAVQRLESKPSLPSLSTCTYSKHLKTPHNTVFRFIERSSTYCMFRIWIYLRSSKAIRKRFSWFKNKISSNKMHQLAKLDFRNKTAPKFESDNQCTGTYGKHGNAPCLNTSDLQNRDTAYLMRWGKSFRIEH